MTGVRADLVGVMQVTWSNNQGGSGTASGRTAWSCLGPAQARRQRHHRDGRRMRPGNAGSAAATVTMTDGTAPTISIATPTAATTFSTASATLALGGTPATRSVSRR
jgi:hypothetical protein